MILGYKLDVLVMQNSLLQVNTSGGVTTNGGSPVVMSPITPELASKIKGELGSPQIIVPAGAIGTSIDWTAKLKVCVP